MAGSPSSVLASLGLDRSAEHLYFRLVPVSGHTVVGAARLVQERPAQLLRDLAPLQELGLVVLEDDRLLVPPLAEALSELVMQESLRATSAAAKLGELARAVPHLVASTTRPDAGDLTDIRPLDGELSSGAKLGELARAVPHLVASTTRPDAGDLTDIRPLDGELSSGGDPLELLHLMLRTSRGDMLWLRPDAWAMPRESRVSELVADAVATGRRSRAIYPARALSEAPEALATRARLGEQVRVISEVPTRMFIFGDAHAVLPEPLGFTDEPRVHVRQRSVVAALTLWFELLWSRAAPVPELESGNGRTDGRQFLLEQLMAGATDEAIARTLGISLRTVRRRVAALMSELGVDTRFQAGVEAARRGWL